MTRSVPISAGGQAPAAVAGEPGNGPPGSPPLSAPTGKYLAYPTILPGGAFSPVNVAATRTAVVAAPVGLQLVNDGSDAPAFSVLSHADATMAIDALAPDGQEWTPSDLVGAPLLGSFFSSFWDFIKHAAATITHIVVSIGKEIYAGIRFIVNETVYFFKHPLQALEDVVSAIGTFFQKLGKLIKNVVEAISILFHLDEIVKTHTLLRDELLKRINGVPRDDPDYANYPGYANLIETNVIPAVDKFFRQTEQDIKAQLDKFKGSLVPGQKVSTLGRAGSTPTTLFTVAPVDNGRPASSHSVACTWAMRKVQAGQKQVSFPSRSPAVGSPSLSQALQDFINTFTKRLADGDLQTDLEKIKSDLNGVFSATSFEQFAEQGMATLFDVVELLLDSVLHIANAFIDSLLPVFADFIAFLFDDSTGLLTQPIKIPVISALYKDAVGTDLTILDLAMLVAAIPVTIVYRVIAGHYPSRDLQTQPGLLQGVNREALRNAFGILGGIATLIAGLMNEWADLLTASVSTLEDAPAEVGDANRFFSVVGLCAAVLGIGATEPNLTSGSPQFFDWVIWGLGLGPAASALIALGVGAKWEAAGEIADIASSIALCVCSIFIVVVGTMAFISENDPGPLGKLLFASLILLVAPGIVNPLKFAPYIGLVVGPLDYWCGVGSAASQFAAAGIAWNQPLG
jgi:hypothetical protein